ncbi:MAG: hypothetical protein J6A74_00580 [Oscillospiraceae bacterium]|nr:hypothetical protein [Oscillospiraceae bacterium]
MNGFSNWLRQLGGKISTGFRRFMQGRYGGDKLNMCLVWVSFGSYLLSLLIPAALIKLLLIALSYGVLGWAIFRLLSRNTYKRYQENRKYLRFVERLKDREHRYYDCPRCRQPVRVPRGRGKIAITCPKCREKFIRKS